MKMQFYKYQGTGNDFIIIDNRRTIFDKNNTKLIAELCDRRYGIGADGLILLEESDRTDFSMVYFNADGNQSTMCGNGGRCLAHFAKFNGLIDGTTTFDAIDGLHMASVGGGGVRLQMQDVIQPRDFKEYVVLDTGSPHFVKIVDAVEDINVDKEGAKIRYSNPFKANGINVNFVEKLGNDKFAVRTYERGVEGETLSCGTGVTAVAIAMHFIGETEKNLIDLQTKGGNLQVSFKRSGDLYSDVWLIGPATQVFKGEISW